MKPLWCYYFIVVVSCLQKSSGAISDARLLHSLARKPSIRHGPSKTVSGQFHMSLVSLMERLEMTNPFFVRCIKSNNSKVIHFPLCIIL